MQSLSTRNPNIDFVKGLLIVFVVIGHILRGSLSDDLLRYIIYLFHMPLFIGLSGFLFNPAKYGGVHRYD